MTYWKTAYFKALQREWYRRLDEAGFQDVEKFVGESMELKQSATHPVRHSKGEMDREIKREYFTMLSEYVQQAEFRNDVDEAIMVLYADGKKLKAICDYLETIGEPRCRHTVRFTIRKYEMKWGIKTYTPRELNQKTR